MYDSALKLESCGKEAILFGGYEPDSVIHLLDSDTQAVIRSALGADTLAPEENIHIVNGRRRIIINEEELERPIVYDYT